MLLAPFCVASEGDTPESPFVRNLTGIECFHIVAGEYPSATNETALTNDTNVTHLTNRFRDQAVTMLEMVMIKVVDSPDEVASRDGATLDFSFEVIPLADDTYYFYTVTAKVVQTLQAMHCGDRDGSVILWTYRGSRVCHPSNFSEAVAADAQLAILGFLRDYTSANPDGWGDFKKP